ncbi:hypothetical protein DY000_02014680 [Brassica cretica]|uniref:Uncharacterized protein n=1 Tax=Brassica cretica TaxID=69181 RepID=A0ABQ7CSE6_BRACR|nr:hypothetical protein DY000_02014680 [Brassica cretica]
MEFLPSLLTKNKNQRKLKERVAVNNGLEICQGHSGNLELLLGFSGHKICSVHILASLSTDTNSISSIDSPSSPRQLPLAKQTDHSSVKRE